MEEARPGNTFAFYFLAADVLEVCGGKADVTRFRQGELLWDATPTNVLCESNGGSSTRRGGGFLGFSCLVRLWGRAQSGAAVAVIVQDALSVGYCRADGKGVLPDLDIVKGSAAPYIRSQLEDGSLRLSLHSAATTNGWRPGPDGKTPVLLHWIRSESWSRTKNKASLEALGASFPIKGEQKGGLCPLFFTCRATSIRPGNWVSLPQSLVREGSPTRLYVQRIAQVSLRDLSPLDLSEVPKIRVLSFDIEADSYDQKSFPQAERDPVITIGATSFEAATGLPRKRTVFQLDDSQQDRDELLPDGTLICWRGKEASLLQGFAELVLLEDPDAIIGYYQSAFDWAFLGDRARALETSGLLSAKDAKRCFHMSRVREQDSQPSSWGKAYGEVVMPFLPGRFHVDLLTYLRRDTSALENHGRAKQS